jgi:hypothetical protein
LKFVLTIIAGVLVGASGVYFSLDWQEEKLNFSVTDPAKFGDISYQNITLVNSGWNPAVNIKVYIDHSSIKYGNVQSSASLSDLSSEKNGIAGIERIRRSEAITIAVAYEGQPLFGHEIKIASDRSIAVQIESDRESLSSAWAASFWSSLALWFGIGIVASISIPAYRDYKKTAKRVADAAAK